MRYQRCSWKAWTLTRGFLAAARRASERKAGAKRRALAVAGEEGGEPVGEGVLGGGPGEAVENEHEDAVGHGSDPLREAELVPEAAQDEEGAEMEGGQGHGVVGGGGLVAAADFVDAVKVGVEECPCGRGRRRCVAGSGHSSRWIRRGGRIHRSGRGRRRG